MLSIRNDRAQYLPSKMHYFNKKRPTCEMIPLARTNGKHMGGPCAIKAQLRKVKCQTRTVTSVAVFFFCMRTPHRTCVHFVGLAYMYAKNLRKKYQCKSDCFILHQLSMQPGVARAFALRAELCRFERSKSLALLSFLASRSLNPEMNRRPYGEKLLMVEPCIIAAWDKKPS